MNYVQVISFLLDLSPYLRTNIHEISLFNALPEKIEKLRPHGVLLTFSKFLSVPNLFSSRPEFPSTPRCSSTKLEPRGRTRLSGLIN